MKTTRGAAPLLVIAAIFVGGLFGVFASKSKLLHGETRRAEASTAATEKLTAAVDAQAASAAADVVVMGRSIAELPESPQKRHLEAETPVVLSKLPSPDPRELLEAEKRRSAIMQGRAEEAERLYGRAVDRAAELERERDRALTARRLADRELEQSAAANRAAERQRGLALLIAGVAGVLYLYAKLTHFSPGQIAEAVADIRAGTPAIQAIDTPATRLQQRIVSILARFRQPHPAQANPPPTA